MTDQTAHDVTDDDRRLAREWASNVCRHADKHFPAERAIARVILDTVPSPPPPTLADMTEEERDECRWMQCDIEGQGGAWMIVAPFDDDDEDYAHVVCRWGSKSWGFPAERITPRPDLPRMEWAGDKKAAVAPALPDGWRLADHEKRGRVIVTNPTPNRNGRVHFVIPADDPEGYGWNVCDPDKLTYIDQEDDQ